MNLLMERIKAQKQRLEASIPGSAINMHWANRLLSAHRPKI